jgi:hypothetical protein
MARLRRTLNGLSLAIILAAAPQTLDAKPAPWGEVGIASDTTDGVTPGVGGSCCNRSGSTCYLNLNGVLVVQSNAYAC